MEIRVGDKVRTLSGTAKIVCIDEVQYGDKYNLEVDKASIGEVGSPNRQNYIVDLDNGRWVYAAEIEENLSCGSIG